MSLSNVTKQIDVKLPSNLSEIPWTRALAAGTLLTSGILLATGRRKAALAVAAAGTAVALLEDPAGVKKFWDDIPGYVEAGQRLLARAEGVIEQIAAQGVQLKDVLKRV